MNQYRARDYVAAKPLHRPPSGPYVDPGRREEALSDALRGVELGAYDEQLVSWMVRFLDDPTLRVIVSWLERVRGADRYERENPVTNGPLPDGVEGRPMGRRATNGGGTA